MSNISIAQNVNDSMSFNQAFAAARTEVGPGGAFVWHGKTYGTYYADEWNSMSTTERNEFSHDAIASTSNGSHSAHDTHTAETGAEADGGAGSAVMATSVSDDMSFNQAFAAARAEVGPGGTFVWHGRTYGTYYADEWNSMSDQERADYYASVGQNANSHIGQNSDRYTAQNNGHEPHEAGPHDYDQPTDNSEGETTAEFIGSGVDENGDRVVAYNIDGQYTEFRDTDGDGIVDIALSDDNGDGVFTQDEIYDMSDARVSIDILDESGNSSVDNGNAYEGDEPFYEGEESYEIDTTDEDDLALGDDPDFDNHANVDDYIA